MHSLPEPHPDRRPLVRADDIAEALDCSGRHVLNMATNGIIPCLRIGRRVVRFVPGDVERALRLPPGIVRRLERRRK